VTKGEWRVEEKMTLEDIYTAQAAIRFYGLLLGSRNCGKEGRVRVG
jgi:hypothetical protein